MREPVEVFALKYPDSDPVPPILLDFAARIMMIGGGP
jgi:hypothetical protein